MKNSSIHVKIERSSLGTRDAVRKRQSVPAARAAQLVQRAAAGRSISKSGEAKRPARGI